MCDLLDRTINIDTATREFQVDKFVYIKDFIKGDLGAQLVRHIKETEEQHKARHLFISKGSHSVITGTDIQQYFPELHYYYHNCLADTVSKIVGKRLYPVNEKSTMNNALFIYENKGDAIDWHTDGSLFNGKNVYTLLVYLYNQSSQNLCYINRDQETKCIETNENSCVILEQFRVVHAVTPLKENEKKILWTMTFAEDMNVTNPVSYLIDKSKNVSYLGKAAINSIDLFFMVLVVVFTVWMVYRYSRRKVSKMS